MPGLGDDIQNMKAGLMEIGDIFVVNKSDREGASRVEQQLLAMLQLAPERQGWQPLVLQTVATESKGIAELAVAIAKYQQHFDHTAERQGKRAEHWKLRLVALAEEQFLKRAVEGADGDAALESLAREVAARQKDPYTAVRELMTRAGLYRSD